MNQSMPIISPKATYVTGHAAHGAENMESSGSVAGATPRAAEAMLNPTRAIVTHTAKETSNVFRRLGVGAREGLCINRSALVTGSPRNTVMIHSPYFAPRPGMKHFRPSTYCRG